jgi:hypothetical protein
MNKPSSTKGIFYCRVSAGLAFIHLLGFIAGCQEGALKSVI